MNRFAIEFTTLVLASQGFGLVLMLWLLQRARKAVRQSQYHARDAHAAANRKLFRESLYADAPLPTMMSTSPKAAHRRGPKHVKRRPRRRNA